MIRRILNRLFPVEEIKRIGSRCEGETYLRRWEITPKSWRWRVFLHEFLLPDEDDLHDHPWNFISIGLKGGYTETTQWDQRRFRAPWFHIRPAEWQHRLTPHKGGCWTLLLSGKHRRDWGFQRFNVDHGFYELEVMS